MAADMTHILEVLGIQLHSQKEKQYLVYKIRRHPRATLDHSKHPEARMEDWLESPWLADGREATALAYKKDQECPEYYHAAVLVPMKESQIPGDLLKELQKRKW